MEDKTYQNFEIHMRGWTVFHHIQPKAPECVKVLRRENKLKDINIITEKQNYGRFENLHCSVL